MKTSAIAACATVLLIAAAPASAATIPVTIATDTVAANAQCSLREAVNSANANNGGAFGCVSGQAAPTVDTITLQALTYTLGGIGGDDANLEGDLDVATGAGPVTIQGLGSSLSIIDPNDNDRIFDFTGANTARIDKVLVRDGQTTGGESGGAIRSSAPLEVTESKVQDSEVTGSAVGMRGGGLAIQGGGTLYMNRSTVTNNSVIHGAGGSGYGVVGGGIGFIGATGNTGVIADSTIDDNHVSAPSTAGADPFPSGGGITHEGPTGGLTVIRSAITRNDLTGGENRSGAGIEFSHNGGAQQLRVDNSTFSLNNSGAASSFGAGIDAIGGVSSVSFSSFSDNLAATGGEAVNFQEGMNPGTASFTIRNSLLDETGPGDCQPPAVATLTSLGGNVESGPTNHCQLTGPNDVLQNTDMVDAVFPNDGATETLALKATALAINRVPSASCLDSDSDPVLTDQRGFARIGNCDSGSYEFGSTGPPVTPPGTGPGDPPVTDPPGTVSKCKKKKAKKGAKKKSKGCKKKKKKK